MPMYLKIEAKWTRLENYYFPKLNQKETRYLNSSITSNLLLCDKLQQA